MRSTRLIENHNAGLRLVMPRLTVHHRPPKKSAPRNTPAKTAIDAGMNSVNIFPPCGMDVAVFLAHPMPSIEAADSEADDEQSEGPGVDSPTTLVEPNASERTDHRRCGHRPTDKTKHAEARPHRPCVDAPRRKLALFLRAHFAAQRRCVIVRAQRRILRHAASQRSGE